jgi:hypothetical protein
VNHDFASPAENVSRGVGFNYLATFAREAFGFSDTLEYSVSFESVPREKIGAITGL